MDISHEALGEIKALLADKSKLPGHFHISQDGDGMHVQFVQNRGAEPLFEKALAKAGVKAKVAVQDGEGRAASYRYESVALKKDEFATFLKAIGAEADYQKILEKPLASKIQIAQIKGEMGDSVTLYYPTEVAAKAALATLPKDILEARNDQKKPSAYVGKGATSGNYYATFPLTPERTAKAYMDIIVKASGKDIARIRDTEDTLMLALGEQSYEDKKAAENITEVNPNRERMTKYLREDVSKGIEGIEKAAKAVDAKKLDKTMAAKMDALKGAMDTLKKPDLTDAAYYDALKAMLAAGQAAEKVLPKSYETDDEAMKNLSQAVSKAVDDSEFAARDSAGRSANLLLKQMGAAMERDTFEAKREKEAADVVKAIDAGKHGADLRKALDKVREIYTKKDGEKTFIDTDRDGKPDTAVQVLRRAAKFADNHAFDHLMMDEATAAATAATILDEIKEGTRGDKQKAAYADIEKKHTKDDIVYGKIITFDGQHKATPLDIIEKVGEQVGVKDYKGIRGAIGLPINALDDIAQWRKDNEAKAPKTPALPRQPEEKKR